MISKLRSHLWNNKRWNNYANKIKNDNFFFLEKKNYLLPLNYFKKIDCRKFEEIYLLHFLGEILYLHTYPNPLTDQISSLKLHSSCEFVTWEAVCLFLFFVRSKMATLDLPEWYRLSCLVNLLFPDLLARVLGEWCPWDAETMRAMQAKEISTVQIGWSAKIKGTKKEKWKNNPFINNFAKIILVWNLNFEQ